VAVNFLTIAVKFLTSRARQVRLVYFTEMDLGRGAGMAGHDSVPIPVLRRLSHYLQHVRMQTEEGREWVSSRQLAEALEVTRSTVRQDLSCLDISGTVRLGYRAPDLEAALLTLLGRDRHSNMVIVGAGNLGRALALHQEFPRQGYTVCGLFDSSPAVVGCEVGNLTVQAMSELPSTVSEKNVEIGVIAVPSSTAQEVADKLVASGVQGVLNMSCAHVKTPEGVSAVQSRIFSSLSLLSHAIRACRRDDGPKKEAETCQVS
jgi:redox-sensing transcriptional repressor